MKPAEPLQARSAIRSVWRSIALVFAVFFALAGAGALYLADAGDENALRLAEEGVNGLATITRKRVDTGHNTNRQASGTRRYVLEYSFPLADGGRQWQGDDEVSEAEYAGVEIGDQFDVRYWPKEPDIATILEDSYAAGAQLAHRIASVLFSLAGLLGLVLLIGKRASRQ